MALSSTARIFRQQGQLPGLCEQLLLSMEMAVGEDSAVPVGVSRGQSVETALRACNWEVLSWYSVGK